jgi:uncharacterized protein YbjQ (UPF0145 family)
MDESQPQPQPQPEEPVAPWRRSGLPIPVTTALDFPEFTVAATAGVASGVYATSLGVGGGFSAGLASMSRGEVGEITRMMLEARHVALGRAVQHALALGANGLVNVRFDSNDVGQSIVEIHCYGTAVLLEA